jgi:Nif-specific regulatory protein
MCALDESSLSVEQAQDPEDRELRKAESLLELATILVQQTHYQEILRLATAKGLELLEAEVVSIIMINPRQEEVVKTICRSGHTAEGRSVRLLQANVVGWTTKHREPFLSEDITVDTRFSKGLFLHAEVRSTMCVPLQSEGRVSGFVVVMNQRSTTPYSRTDLAFLQRYAAVCAPFLSNAQRVQEYFAAATSEDVLLTRFEHLGLLGQSQRFRELLRSIDAAAKSDVRVFLEGQSGTGKEVIAQAIHRLGGRSTHPFMAVDCGAIPASLVESELFGHVRGAFTDATHSRKGLIEEADGGTLFLDDVDNLPPSMQLTMLRVLQENEIRAVGSDTIRKVNVRVVAASSRPIWEMVKQKEFREDLFYRLHVYPIMVPSLNDRSEDIPLLAEHFLRVFAEQQRKNLRSLHPMLVQFLRCRSWSGNVRELENFMERLVTLAPQEMSALDHTVIPREFEREFRALRANRMKRITSRPLRECLTEFQAEIIRQTLVEYHWNQSETARALDVSERTIRYAMEKLGIKRPT